MRTRVVSCIPRRVINGTVYTRPGPWRIDQNGIVGYVDPHKDLIEAGFAMGCIKNDNGLDWEQGA